MHPDSLWRLYSFKVLKIVLREMSFNSLCRSGNHASVCLLKGETHSVLWTCLMWISHTNLGIFYKKNPHLTLKFSYCFQSKKLWHIFLDCSIRFSFPWGNYWKRGMQPVFIYLIRMSSSLTLFGQGTLFRNCNTAVFLPAHNS